MSYRKLHHMSGIVISIFIALHLFNHLYSIYGAEAHIAMMEALRPIYRNRFFESVLLLAVLSQIVSGLKLIFGRKGKSKSFFERLHAWSGIYLAVFLIIHVGSVLVGRFLLRLDTNFYFGVAGLNTFPLNLFFIPYYTLALLSFFGHVAAVHYVKMKIAVFGLDPKRQSYLILLFGLLLTFIIFYGLTDRFQGVDIPEQYNVLIGK